MGTYTTGDDNFKCISEDIPSTGADKHMGKRRIVSVEAKIVRKASVTRGAAPNPMVGSMKDYLHDAPKLQQIGYENGHLVALELGGPDDPVNIAPMLSWFNQVRYRKLENELYNNASILRMQVKITYHTTSSLLAVPSAFEVLIKKKDDVAYTRYDYLPMSVPVASPFPFDSDVRDAVAAILPDAKPRFEPYAFLEELELVTPGDTSEFTEKQRTYILTANALYSLQTFGDPFLRSDDADDTFKVLNLEGGKDRPQVDHVVPRSRGGSNSFRNAVVLSQDWNGKKSAKLDDELIQVLAAATDRRPIRTARNTGSSHYHPYNR